MENPASHPGFIRTCPACNRQVAPGYNFCEVCGTRIPELCTCSKCGTQFAHPETFCDLCGAPFILEGEKEPGEKERPEHFDNEIPEPDTDELLELYGKEYGEDETLESCHTPRPPSPLQRGAKKPVTVPALQGVGSSHTVDDTLFLLNDERVKAKPLMNKTWIMGGGIVLITILLMIFFIGLPMVPAYGGFSAYGNPTAAEITPIAEPTPAGTTPPVMTAPSSRLLVPLPTQLIPTDQTYYFQVRKNPITSKISVIFAGSAGEGSIRSADIKVTHTDGSVSTGIILPLKGMSEITLDGSKETDRVEIIAKMSSGETYRVYDNLVPLIR